MKKGLLILTVVAIVALMVTACGASSSLVVLQPGDNVTRIEVDNATKDMDGSASIQVAEGEQIYIEPSLKGGEMKLEFYDSKDEDHENLLTDFVTSGTEPGVVGIGAGDFDIVAISLADGVSGEVTISAKAEEGPEQWNEAATAEEAAKGAGLDTFEYGEGTTISLGEVKAEKLRYMEGVARADIPIAAVEMWVCKGLASIDEGDVSFDDEEYKHEWEQNVKGLVVKCFGNRKGEATKTIWTTDDYAYAIVAHGAGGDDDYGLSADDVSSLINSIQ